MPIPAAVPVVVGGARALAGVMGAQSQGKRQRKRIQEAYAIDRQQLDQHQTDTRQSQLEGLAARGLVQNGAQMAAAPQRESVTAIESAYNKSFAGKSAKALTDAGFKHLPKTMTGRQPELIAEAKGIDAQTRGGVGPANTLAGGLQSDMNDAFFLEQQDLVAGRESAREDVNAAQQDATIGAIAGGISTGIKANDAFGMLGSLEPGSKIKGAFGIDPANPTSALNPLSGYGTEWHANQPNFAFNVAKARGSR